MSAPRIVFLNGAFLPIEAARIPVMDRGFLFGDGIYEVTAVVDGRFLDNDGHLARLDRSLAAIEIPNPYPAAEWVRLQNELVARNDLKEGLIYIEVTRGVWERDFVSPDTLAPTVVMFTQEKAIREQAAAKTGIKVITVPDLRWARRDIKSVSLLAQVMAKRAARAAGVGEAWMVEDGVVTEGASSTAFIVTADRAIVTRPLSQKVLAGITRKAILAIAEAGGYRLVERAFTLGEALAAQEAFITSASTLCHAVVAIDGQTIGDGRPGPVALELRQRYLAEALG